jgi:hypothetical protein
MNLRSVLISSIASTVVALGACSKPGTPLPTAAQPNSEIQRRMAQAAEQTLDHFIRERDVGQQPLTPEFLERLHVWSWRLSESKCALAKTRDERVAVVSAHLEHMKRLHQITNQSFGEGRPRQMMTAYYVAEAELWLERVKKE